MNLADIAANLSRLEERIEAACERSGRARSDVTLVAVSKTHPPELVEAAARAGVTDVGENRVQEAATKIPQVGSPLTWHLIGHLQTNKAARAVELFPIIHSVDSPRIADELQRRCEQADRTVKVLVEVNTSAEPTKFGVNPERIYPLLEHVLGMDRLVLEGLMTIGPGWAIEDPEASRPCFRTLGSLVEAARQRFGAPLPHLSMGMSVDFEQAIEEGATIIRVGSAIFGQRN